ncbi:DUF1797 family protein [Planococcus lenghuensis]|uniref:Uncharacterized protein n=1 Tax=Planococcus lenghuensis TaxID=2213202 RepID=A0A1Q2KZ04_9BACL|nr:DUF1797 family protein [Planococcus lenghuensis]AQQ53366.1 hypothetical protein B0X71_09950 [Planococcus lenghuensis]
MSEEHLRKMLETLSLYNTTNITQTFDQNGESVIKVSILPNTETFKVTHLPTQTIAYFDSQNDVINAIKGLLNE